MFVFGACRFLHAGVNSMFSLRLQFWLLFSFLCFFPPRLWSQCFLFHVGEVDPVSLSFWQWPKIIEGLRRQQSLTFLGQRQIHKLYGPSTQKDSKCHRNRRMRGSTCAKSWASKCIQYTSNHRNTVKVRFFAPVKKKKISAKTLQNLCRKIWEHHCITLAHHVSASSTASSHKTTDIWD